MESKENKDSQPRPLPGVIQMVLLACLCALLAGCASSGWDLSPFPPAVPALASGAKEVVLTNQIEPAWLLPSADMFTLGPGDKLEIEFIGDTNSLTTSSVGPDGKLYFNLLPGLDVWGMTLSQARGRIEEELSKYVREKPQVSLALRAVESKHVWLLGYVQAPGIYPLATPTTLLEAISLAGGTLNMSSFHQQEATGATGASDELADLRRSFVLRQGKMLPVDFERLLKQGDLSQNIYLQPDDFIFFPPAKAREIYVLGAVAEPRAVPYKEGMTVVAAVASAYGTITGAYMHHVAVVRGSLTHPQITVVDYKEVLRGNAMDIALEPHDIVFVPFSPYRYLYRYAQLIVDTFVSSAAINAGTAWIGHPIGGTSVFIPVGTATPAPPAIAVPPVK